MIKFNFNISSFTNLCQVSDGRPGFLLVGLRTSFDDLLAGVSSRSRWPAQLSLLLWMLFLHLQCYVFVIWCSFSFEQFFSQLNFRIFLNNLLWKASSFFFSKYLVIVQSSLLYTGMELSQGRIKPSERWGLSFVEGFLILISGLMVHWPSINGTKHCNGTNDFISVFLL